MDRAGRLAMVRDVTEAFDLHDLDRIMRAFSDDAVFDSPRGADPWGHRFVGPVAIRAAFAARFAGIPDVRYQEDEHFVDGDRGASTWVLRGHATDGTALDVGGCDLWRFRDDRIVVKDSYWKIRTAGSAREP